MTSTAATANVRPPAPLASRFRPSPDPGRAATPPAPRSRATADGREEEVPVGHPDAQREEQVHHRREREEKERDPERDDRLGSAKEEDARHEEPRPGAAPMNATPASTGSPGDGVKSGEPDGQDGPPDVEGEDLRPEAPLAPPCRSADDAMSALSLSCAWTVSQHPNPREDGERRLFENLPPGDPPLDAEIVRKKHHRKDDRVALGENRRCRRGSA